MKKLYLFLFLLCVGAVAKAQTAISYGFTSLSLPFVSIAGLPASTEALTVESEDATQLDIPIGFPFTYCGVPYNSVAACANGWLSLSMTASTYTEEYFDDPIGIDDGGGTGAGWLMPFWEDLSGDLSHAYYSTTGIAPNRVFTFEWTNWQPSAFSFFATGSMSFQVKLYESTNVIDFCYGAPGDYAGFSATIGIANDQVSDWQTLPDELAGTLPTTDFNNFIFGSPAIGQVYRWAPPTCTPAAITGIATVCAGVSASTTTLADATAGGTWSSSSAATGTVDATSGVVTGIAAGTTIITYSTGPACYTTRVVTVNAATPISGTLTVCLGSTTALSSGPAGGAWSSGFSGIASVSAAGVVSGVASGVSNISYTTADGCVAVAVATVNPVPAAITGSIGMCVGTTTTLNSTTFGGTWTSSTTGVATVVPATGVVTAIALGTSTISYTLATGCYATTVITVNTSVAPITGTAELCVGTTTALSSATGGGTWSSSATGVATADLLSGMISGISNGTSTISYSLGAGCFTTKDVTVSPVPAAITGTLSVCQGATTALGHPVTGGVWSTTSPDLAVATGSGIVSGVAVGTGIITYTVPPASGSCPVTAVVTVNAIPNAITGALQVCAGNTTTLSTTTPGVSWASSNTGVATVGITTGIVNAATAGNTTITATGMNGCTRTAVVTVNPLPSAIAGLLTVCSGSATTLSSSPAPGAWSSSTAAMATVNALTGVVTGTNGTLTQGTSVITYTLATGCMRTAVVTVNPIPAAIVAAPVCVGLTTTLTTSPAGGTWSSSNSAVAPIVATTGIVTGIANGTATITYTLATGCRRTRTVTVNPVPAPISGATSLCPTTSITLSDATPGGTWSSLNTPIATAAAATGVVTGVATGFATINYTLSTGCLASAVVTVTAAPTAAITALGDTALCPGGFVALAATTVPGVTYEWYEDGATTGVNTPTYLVNIAGSYQVRVSLIGGCSIMSLPMSVSVVPATATITLPGGSATGCSGAGVTLDATAGTGMNYQWLFGGAPMVGATNATYTATASGNYAVVISNSTGCSASSAAMAITVSATPAGIVTASGPLSVCGGTGITLTADGGSGYTYQWSNASGPIAGATNISYTTTAGGSYFFTETNVAGCMASSAVSNVTENPAPNAAVSYSTPLVFCADGSVALNAQPGYSYQWYNNGIAISGATNITYVANASGGYKVRVTDAATGCTALTAANTVVTVIASPDVIALTPARFCWGGSSLLSTSVSSAGSAVSYHWQLNGSDIPGATGSTYSAANTGLYSCNIAVSSGCLTTTTTVAVVEHPLPDPLISFDGTVFHTQAYFVAYQWYKDLVLIPGATAAGTPAISNGNYKVAVTDTNGCHSVSDYYVLTNYHGNAAGVSTVSDIAVRIYPNPARGIVHIESPVAVRAVITGIDGRELMNVNDAQDVNISNLANGVYMIMIYDASQHIIKTERLVKAAE